MHCPGSVQMADVLPNSGDASPYAAEGTAAHDLAEMCLNARCDAHQRVGQSLSGGYSVTVEMAEHVQLYLDTCREAVKALPQFWIECRFDLAPLHPPVDMFGTADFVAYNAATRKLRVIDFKYGQGVIVEPKGNPQLMYYALGAALVVAGGKLVKARSMIDEIELTIVQPRAPHPDGPVRSFTITFQELANFAVELIAAANATTKPNAPRIPGKQCRWCPASGICPEQREEALNVAQSDFAVILHEPAAFVPPAPATIPLDEFATMLVQLHVLEDWAAAMRQHAAARLERGEEVPGYKLVEKRAVRQWTDPQEVIETMRAAGWDENEIFAPRVLKSVAQIEKLAGGKAAFAEWPVAALVKKESSGLRLAPESDPSPAVVLTMGQEFPLLTAGSPEEE